MRKITIIVFLVSFFLLLISLLLSCPSLIKAIQPGKDVIKQRQSVLIEYATYVASYHMLYFRFDTSNSIDIAPALSSSPFNILSIDFTTLDKDVIYSYNINDNSILIKGSYQSASLFPKDTVMLTENEYIISCSMLVGGLNTLYERIYNSKPIYIEDITKILPGATLAIYDFEKKRMDTNIDNVKKVLSGHYKG